MTKNKILKLLAGVGLSLVIAGTGFGFSFVVRPAGEEEKNTVVELSANIELSKTQVPAIIETAEGEIEVDLPTVEAVDSANVTGLLECQEDEVECGMGAYSYAPTETPQAFAEYTIGNCYNTDGSFDEQCWDYGDLFWQNYAGRRLSTCGSGAAKGTIVDGCWQINAGDDFEMVWDAKDLQYGDIAVFDNGTWGHLGFVVGAYNNGYIALQGQNQGGGLCPGSTMGSRVNVINISLKHFAGAFRPKAYIKPEPEPEPLPVSGCAEWHVARGDTMSAIMLECENTVVYGAAMDSYAKSWFSRNVKPGQSVYDGWHSESGVGLYAGDWIDHDLD